MDTAKRVLTLVAMAFLSASCAGSLASRADGERLVEQPKYLSKILLVVDARDPGAGRAQYEAILQNSAQLYTPRVATVMSAPLAIGAKSGKDGQGYTALATQNNCDGILVLTELSAASQEKTVCPHSKTSGVIDTAIDILTTSCTTVHVPNLIYEAQLYSTSPYQPLWKTQVSSKGSEREPRSNADLFRDISIAAVKGAQRAKFILPSRYQN